MNQSSSGGASSAGHDAAHERIQGVFSTQSVMRVGTGATTRKTIQKTYWFVRENDSGNVDIQPLNKNYVPSGPKRPIPRDEFLAKFAPEPEFYTNTVFPKMRELALAVKSGEEAREAGELYSAEFEFSNAVKVDESNVRANFGLGLTYMERGERSKANDIFERLVKLEAAFEPQHKHLFNEFGINLRKTRMYEQAIDYYRRALELSPDDENLHYNAGRAYYEMGALEQAVKHLRQSATINPALEEPRKFLEYIVRKNKGEMNLPFEDEAAPAQDDDL